MSNYVRNYIPIGQHQVTSFVDEKAQIEAAARELFYAYIVALPDKDDWHGQYGWRLTSEQLRVTIDATGIEYHSEYFTHGDTEYHSLNLPLSALYDPNFLAEEQDRWVATKEKVAADRLQEEEIAKQKKLEADRKMYEHLMQHFDPEIYERMKHTENNHESK